MTARRPGESERTERILSGLDFDAPTTLGGGAHRDLHAVSVKTAGELPAARRVTLLCKGCGHQSLAITCPPCAVRYSSAAVLVCWCGRRARRITGWVVTIGDLPKQVAR